MLTLGCFRWRSQADQRPVLWLNILGRSPMKRNDLHFVKVCSLLLVAFFWAKSAGAQATTGSIYGRVTDSSKAIVVGARVVATNARTGVSYPSTPDSSGDYVILNLPPATYSVTATKDGFS